MSVLLQDSGNTPYNYSMHYDQWGWDARQNHLYSKYSFGKASASAFVPAVDDKIYFSIS